MERNAWECVLISAHPNNEDIRAFERVCAQITAFIGSERQAEAVDLGLTAAEEYVRNDCIRFAERVLAIVEPFASECPRFRALDRWGIWAGRKTPRSLLRDQPIAPVIALHARVDASALRGLTDCVVRRHGDCGCLHLDVWPACPREVGAAFRRSEFAAEITGERYPMVCQFTQWTERGDGRCTCTIMPIPPAAHDRAFVIIRTGPDGRTSTVPAIIVAALGVPRRRMENAVRSS